MAREKWQYLVGHGSCVAGLIAAESNGLGGVGVAFDASLMDFSRCKLPRLVLDLRAGQTSMLDDTAFLTTIYQNALLTEPDAGGLVYWDNYLDSHSRAELIASWVNATELLATQFGTEGLGLV